MSDDIMYDSKEDCYMVSEERLEEFEKALKERDELAAELERVKAELEQTYHVLKNLNTVYESLKSRLPVNRDGDVPDIGDKQWYWYDYPGSSPEELEIECVCDNGGGWGFGFTNGAWHFSSYCHSTAESCRAANSPDTNTD